MEVLFDVVGSCNLRCPSCPVGHTGNVNPTGLIDTDLVRALIAKADREYKIIDVSLFNWAEPLLHPSLPELVRIVKQHHLKCSISSNLNVLRDNIDEVLLAYPDFFRISLSGFSQPVYSQTHAGGNIERVKENMRKLSEAVRRTKSRTAISVYYHKYKHNLHEKDVMCEYAQSLGFGWREDWAYFMGLEKLLDYTEGRRDAYDVRFIEDKLALPISESLASAKQFRDEPCKLWNNQLVFDLQGNLMPCCTVYDYKKHSLGKFLDLSPSDVHRVKQAAAACEKCMANGLHAYAAYPSHPKLKQIYEELTNSNLKRHEEALSQQERSLRRDVA